MTGIRLGFIPLCSNFRLFSLMLPSSRLHEPLLNTPSWLICMLYAQFTPCCPCYTPASALLSRTPLCLLALHPRHTKTCKYYQTVRRSPCVFPLIPKLRLSFCCSFSLSLLRLFVCLPVCLLSASHTFTSTLFPGFSSFSLLFLLYSFSSFSHF